MVWGPGLIDKDAVGSVNATSYFAAIDLVPSLIEVAGVTKPDGVEFDGHPMSEVLLGRSKSSRPEPLFFRRPPDRPTNAAGNDLPDLAVRDGKWKLLCNYDGSQVQLYDLTLIAVNAITSRRRIRTLFRDWWTPFTVGTIPCRLIVGRSTIQGVSRRSRME